MGCKETDTSERDDLREVKERDKLLEQGSRILRRAQGLKDYENGLQQLCTQQKIRPNHAKRRGLSRRPGPPLHDDLVTGNFTDSSVNELWLTADIERHEALLI